MSDTFILCPKCGEEIETYKYYMDTYYWCSNCVSRVNPDYVKKVTTEYFDNRITTDGNIEGGRK